MDMETDGPMLDDVGVLKKAMEEEATQVSEQCNHEGKNICQIW